MLIYFLVLFILNKAVPNWESIAPSWTNVAPGWTSLIVSLWAIGGLLMMSIGVVGAYIGKIYLETKERPRFIIEDYLEDKEG